MSRMLRWITTVVGLISIVSCNSSALTPTLSPQTEPIDASPTPRAVPSPVRLVTTTSMPTVTSRPEPQAPGSDSPLMSTGPYFVFARNRELNQVIVTNQDGSGRKVVNLPTGLTVNQWFYRDFSPKGNGLVVFRRDFTATPPEMELYILQLPGAGLTKVADLLALTKVADLLAPDYPAGLVEVARRWPTELPGLFSPSEDWISRPNTTCWIACCHRVGRQMVAFLLSRARPQGFHLTYMSMIRSSERRVALRMTSRMLTTWNGLRITNGSCCATLS